MNSHWQLVVLVELVLVDVVVVLVVVLSPSEQIGELNKGKTRQTFC